MIYTLNQAEQAICKWIAKSRFANNRMSGVFNDRRGPQSDDQTDLDGFGAEMAFCRLFNAYPDFTLQPRRSGSDCVINSGDTVDVKQTRYKSGKLIVKTGKDEYCDIFALMIGEFPTYRYAGFTTREKLVREENVYHFGNSTAYFQNQLSLWKTSPVMGDRRSNGLAYGMQDCQN